MKRALVCSYYAPQVDRDSGSRRIMELIDALLGAGWRVGFVAAHPDSGRYEQSLRQRGVAVYDGSGSIDAVLLTERFDVAVLAYWPIAERFLPAIRRASPHTRVLVDSEDLHYLRYARHLFGAGAGMLDRDFGDQLVGEINTYAAADAVIAISDKEAQVINDLTGEPSLAFTMPLGEAVLDTPTACGTRRGCVFVGNFQHTPNAEAVEFLCQQIVPRLAAGLVVTHPVYVVGSGMTEAVRRLGDGVPGVRMVGWVPDLGPYLQRVRAALVPLRHGAGVKGKLIGAMAAGTPVVTTSVGVEGLDVRDGEHVLIADAADSFADAVERLLTDDSLWARLSDGGRELVERRYSKAASRRIFLAGVETALSRPPKPPRLPVSSAGLVAQYETRMVFQDRHRVTPPVRDLVGAPARERGSARPRVLVVGVYLSDQVNTADRIVPLFEQSRWCLVSQRWAALGGAGAGPGLREVTALTVSEKTPKFALMNRLLAGVDLDTYDYVVMADDDIGVAEGFLDAFIAHQEQLDFAIAQPARTRTSPVDHPIVEQQLGVVARRTQFVEIGPVVSFHRSVFRVVFPFDLVSPMGWGYENVWAFELTERRLRMGIIDATPVEHILRPTLANYSWAVGDAGRQALLARRAHLPLDECMRVLEVLPAESRVPGQVL